MNSNIPERIWVSLDRSLKWTDYAFDNGIEFARVHVPTGKVSAKDQATIHDLVSEYADRDNMGLLKTKLAEYVATVRREEKEAAFKVLCADCAEGDEPILDQQARWFYHGIIGCSASKLRIEAAAIKDRENE